ncbi:unnamed protein product [Linum tenue]|uniref:BHLH domain-containing protein n=1 Tax=Linum tenue TaxID=586396 RepID=A0AAV0HRK7_9ROSI|nr:unnamed protein product [Linum tenue]
MESVFGMAPEMELPAYLQALMHHLGSSYICLWSHLPHRHPHNNSVSSLLVFAGGFYHQHQPIPSSSSSSSPRSPPPSSAAANRHFQDYTRSTFTPIIDRVPGHAFLINHPYVELSELPELLRMASNLSQRLFYQTAVFMGCRSGEIELGWSNPTAQQMSIEGELMKLFPDDFSRLLTTTTAANNNNTGLPPRPSSSSTSSVRSSALSLDHNSPEYSSFLLNLTANTAATSSPAFHPPPPPRQPYAGLFPSTQMASMEDAAMTRALLAIFTSAPPTAAAAPSNHQGRGGGRMPRRTTTTTTAFKKFAAAATPPPPTRGVRVAGQSMFKRAITYYRRSFTTMTRSARDMSHQLPCSRPTTTQLHHMISERRRREKINDSFHSLRSLLPPDAKKDKASVLSRTKEYMSSLIAQVADLAERNRHLESKLDHLLNSRPLPPAATSSTVPVRIKAAAAAAAPEYSGPEGTIPCEQRVVDVRLRTVEETTTTSSEQHGRVVELQVSVGGGDQSSSSSLVSDVVIRVLEFLRQVNNVDLVALEANASTDTLGQPSAAASTAEPTPSISRAVFLLQIEGDDEWDEAAFQEAVRRVVADLAQSNHPLTLLQKA